MPAWLRINFHCPGKTTQLGNRKRNYNYICTKTIILGTKINRCPHIYCNTGSTHYLKLDEVPHFKRHASLCAAASSVLLIDDSWQYQTSNNYRSRHKNVEKWNRKKGQVIDIERFVSVCVPVKQKAYGLNKKPCLWFKISTDHSVRFIFARKICFR